MGNRSKIAVINQKGGVGKTTTVINLAASLSILGQNNLIIDLDPQGNATTGLGLSNVDNSSDTIYGVLNGTREINEIIKRTQFENLDIITSNVDLSGLEVETADDSNRAFILKAKLSAYLNNSRASYDYILIDCPPSLSMLTVNAFVAAKSVIITMQCEYFALEGLSALLKTIRRIADTVNPTLEIEGILRTMYDPRNSLTGEVSSQLHKHFGDLVYRTVIPRNVRLAEAPSHGLPALHYDRYSSGARAYAALAGEFVKKQKQAEA